jgi:acyl carrier protein
MTPAEIAAIMGEIIGIDGMGVDDDFFHVGGKSWGALALMMRLHEQSGVEVPLLDVFHARTPSRLAAFIAERSATGSVST